MIAQAKVSRLRSRVNVVVAVGVTVGWCVGTVGMFGEYGAGSWIPWAWLVGAVGFAVRLVQMFRSRARVSRDIRDS